jgi:hypothetical protein
VHAPGPDARRSMVSLNPQAAHAMAEAKSVDMRSADDADSYSPRNGGPLPILSASVNRFVNAGGAFACVRARPRSQAGANRTEGQRGDGPVGVSKPGGATLRHDRPSRGGRHNAPQRPGQSGGGLSPLMSRIVSPSRRRGRRMGLCVGQRLAVDHEAIFHVALLHAIIGVVDILDLDHLDIGGDALLGAEIEHLLRLGDAADQ